MYCAPWEPPVTLKLTFPLASVVSVAVGVFFALAHCWVGPDRESSSTFWFARPLVPSHGGWGLAKERV